VLKVILGEPEDLQRIWMKDRKGYAETFWPPPNISKLSEGKDSLTNAVSCPHHTKAMRRIMEPFFTPTSVRTYWNVVDQVT
jgi:hypothetical protein